VFITCPFLISGIIEITPFLTVCAEQTLCHAAALKERKAEQYGVSGTTPNRRVDIA